MGYASSQRDNITTQVSSVANKILAIFNKKINTVGEELQEALQKALLEEACRHIPHPLLVMSYPTSPNDRFHQ